MNKNSWFSCDIGLNPHEFVFATIFKLDFPALSTELGEISRDATVLAMCGNSHNLLQFCVTSFH